MTQGFFQFNNSIIDEIINFATSSFDLLYMSGPKGSSKSETIEKVIPILQEDNLVFRHFCFQNSVIDDFLMNFYDALRNFSITQKISIKKFATTNFKEKVSHYFKTINSNCIIIVENFEQIEKNVEIIDFLSHLANFINVKIIIVSRNFGTNLFRFKKIKIQNLGINPITKEDFKSKLAILADINDEEVKEKFYSIADGIELYLKLAVKYSNITNIQIKELVLEYERKNTTYLMNFEEFLASKFISLIPSIYKNLFKTLCTFSSPVSEEFLKEYKLNDDSCIQYLKNNFLINSFKDEIYVKDYFKDYILKSFSIQEKITYYKNLIEIYEKELTKSPKDRLIRLSRESIRKEIAFLNSIIPNINNKARGENAFSYLTSITPSIQNEEITQKTKLREKLDKIKQRRSFLSKENNIYEAEKKNTINFYSQNKQEKENEENRIFIINYINNSRILTQTYKYNEAICELQKALQLDYSNEFKIEILILIAKNYENLNEYNYSERHYEKALEYAQSTKDSRIAELKFLIGICNKYQFKTDIARELFKQIAKNENYSKLYRSKSFIELGEIYEADTNIEEAIEQYERALNFSLGYSKKLAAKSYYRLGVLYDENQDIENAIKYYRKNYTIGSDENKYYSASLTNLALIYADNEKIQEAKEFFKLALNYDNEVNDLENVYFSQKELAKLYLKSNEMTAINYFKQALSTAQKLEDNFKIALIYFETGEYYYDKGIDEKALINFNNAKIALKSNPADENVQRVNSRIKDIKVRMDEVTFKLISEKYDK